MEVISVKATTELATHLAKMKRGKTPCNAKIILQIMVSFALSI